MGPAGVRSTGREVGGGARGWGVCGRAEGQTCRVTEAAPHRAPFCDGGLSPMAGRGFGITGTDTSTSSCVPIPVGHEGRGRHRPHGHLPQQCLERQRGGCHDRHFRRTRRHPGGAGPVAMAGACWLVAWGCKARVLQPGLCRWAPPSCAPSPHRSLPYTAGLGRAGRQNGTGTETAQASAGVSE